MADIISKIVLQAQGGDSVAREIGKVKQAYDEAGESAKRIQPSGIGSGTPAPQQGGMVDQGAEAAKRHKVNEDLIKKNLSDRADNDLLAPKAGKSPESDELAQSIKNLKKTFDELSESAKKLKDDSGDDPFERATEPKTPAPAGAPAVPGAPPPAGSPGAPGLPGAPSTSTGTLSPSSFTRNAASMMGAVGQFGAGDAIGAIGSGVQAATGMLGVGASTALLGVAGAMAINKLAETAAGREEQLVFSGLAQRLGKTKYEQISDPILAMGDAGYKATALPMLQALATSGATTSVTDRIKNDTTGATSASPLEQMLSMQYKTGIDGAVIGKMYGTLRSAGGGGGTVYMGGDTGRAAQSAFGTSRSTEFLSTVTSGIQRAMTEGIAKGSKIFATDAYDVFVRPLRDLATHGNLAPEAASAVYGKMQNTILGTSSGIQTPEDTMQFMMFRKEGESYFDTIRRMSDPSTETERYRNLQGMAGGDKDVLTHMLMQTYGLNIHEADAYQKSLNRRVILDDALKSQVIDPSTGKVVRPDTGMDDTALRHAQAAHALERTKVDATQTAIGIKTAVIEWVRDAFGPTLSPEAREMHNQIDKINKNKSSLYSDIKSDISDQVPSTEFLKLFNPDVATFAQTAFTGMSQGKFGPEGMRNFINKGNTREREAAIRNNPITGETGLLTELGAYGQWKSGVEVTPAEDTYFKSHAEKFELAGKLVGENEYLRTQEGMTALLETLKGVNESKQFDKDVNFLSIAEALFALIKVLETKEAMSYTPSNGVDN